jgi:hypothetical protein
MGILDFFNTQQNAWNAQQANSPYTPDMRLNAGMQSLGLLGGTMMAAGAPTTDPGAYGRIMGQGMAQRGPMMQQSLDQQMQMQDMMSEREREAAMQEWWDANGASMFVDNPELAGLLSTMPMEDRAKVAFDYKTREQTDPRGDVVVGADGYKYWSNTQERVLPDVVQPEETRQPKMVQAVDPTTGQLTWMWDYDALGLGSALPEGNNDSPFGGTALDVQLINTLRTFDPASQDYAIAYSILGAPKYSYNPATNEKTLITQDMSMFPEPTFILPAETVEAINQANEAIGAPTIPTGTAPVAEAPSVNDRTGGVQVVKSDELPLADQRAYNAGIAVIEKVDAALNDYKNVLMPNGQMLGREELLNPTSPESIRAAAARTNLMMEMKELFDLGVLTGPDMGLLEDMTADPTSFFSRGILMGPEGFAAQFDVISDKLGAARTILDEQFGITQPAQDGGSTQDTPSAPAPVRTDGTFSGRYTPEGYPIYIRPDGTSFAPVNNDG